MRNKEAVFGALSSFIKSENFHGKRQFIEDYNGLDFLASLMNDEVATASLRLYKKVLTLAHDLVVNDDTIFKENPFVVREYFAQSEAIMNQLLKSVSDTVYSGDLEDLKMLDVRGTSIRILARVYQFKAKELAPTLLPVLFKH